MGELRWPLELAHLLRSPVFHGAGVPHGDGSPVLVIPGFASSDASASVLRGWLRRTGYTPYASGIALNVDCSDRVFERLDDRLAATARQSARRVAIVGHSRGGQLARALAARRPELVSHVVALGSGLNDPFAISVPLHGLVRGVRTYHQAVTDRQAHHGCLTRDCRCAYSRWFRAALPGSVRVTSIYASADGVMRREACVVPGATNVEVPGTHAGLAFNRDAYRAIAEALADGHSRTYVPGAGPSTG